MTRPSRDWLGFTSIDKESEKYKLVQLVFTTANFGHLEKHGIDSRRRLQATLPPDINCHINQTRFASGYNNVVVELTFSDGVLWVARIPYRTMDDTTKTSLLSEIATMKIIRNRTSIPVPKIFEFELSSNQPFGYPYVLMESMGGSTLDDGLVKSIPVQHHPKVAKQLASIFMELQNLTFARIGRLWCGETAEEPVKIISMAWHASPGPLDTSLEYFYNQRNGENREILAMYPSDPDWRTACWVLKTSLAQSIVEDRVQGPFPLCHLDLHFGNLLFDDDYNLTGVIDWSNAQAAPLEQLSVCPELVTFPGLSDEANRPIVEFKALVVQSLSQMEKSKEQMQPSDRQPADARPNQDMTSLSTYMASKNSLITHRQYMASPKGSLWASKEVAKLIYGKHITWEQLREVYGSMPSFWSN